MSYNKSKLKFKFVIKFQRQYNMQDIKNISSFDEKKSLFFPTKLDKKSQDKKACSFFLHTRKTVYKSILMGFINSLMKNGNQETAEKILQNVFLLLKHRKKQTKYLQKLFFFKAIQNVKPLMELKNQQSFKSASRRASKLKAVPISSKRAQKLAIQWIIDGAKQRTETMGLSLYLELLNAYEKKGYAIKKKIDLHQRCKINFFQSKKASK